MFSRELVSETVWVGLRLASDGTRLMQEVFPCFIFSAHQLELEELVAWDLVRYP